MVLGVAEANPPNQKKSTALRLRMPRASLSTSWSKTAPVPGDSIYSLSHAGCRHGDIRPEEVMHAKIQALLSPVNRKDVDLEEMKQNGTLKHQCEHDDDAFPTAPGLSLHQRDRSNCGEARRLTFPVDS